MYGGKKDTPHQPQGNMQPLLLCTFMRRSPERIGDARMQYVQEYTRKQDLRKKIIRSSSNLFMESTATFSF